MKSAPNILFVFSDQQHWQAAGFVDPSFKTPNMDRLASDGIVFENAFCTTPQCSPSRSSMITGFYPSKTGVLGNVGQAGGDPLRMRTIGSMLKDAGYYTGYFGKWHLGKDSVGTAGWDEDLGVTGPETRDDKECSKRAIDFLKRRKGKSAPFALFISYNDPHDIYHVKREKDISPKNSIPLPDSWGLKDLSTTPSVQKQFMEEDHGKFISGKESPAWQRYREFYRDKVSLYDSELGTVLNELEKSGEYKNTLIIVTSDHGDMDAQHGLVLKGPFMYEHMMRVPLIIRPPGDSFPQKISEFHTVNVDLVPTIADLAGIEALGTDGVSLKPFLCEGGKKPQREFVIGQYYSKQSWVNPIRMIRTEKFKYNQYRVHGEELYDLEKDPMEIANLAKDPKYSGVKSELREKLEEWIRKNNDLFYSQSPTNREGGDLNYQTNKEQ